MSWFRNKRIISLLLAVLAIVLVLGSYGFKNRYNLLQNGLVQMVIPVYHSFRKIPDILFIPQSFFTKSAVTEKYDIFIPYENVERMNAALTDEPFSGTLEDTNKVWVSAQFRSGDYNEEVKIRYRGQLANHWNSYKKSYLIKFPKDNLFNGMREMTLIIPVDRKYFSTSLNNYRAKKMGLVVPEEFYPKVTLNGADMGIYLAMEHWSQEFIEKNPISALSNIYSVYDIENFEDLDEGYSVYRLDELARWKSLNNDIAQSPEIEALLNLVGHTDDETFKKLAPVLLDLDAFYAQDTINILTGGYHLSDDGNNLILLFNNQEGRFEPIPFNAGVSDTGDSFLIEAPRLQKRIWSIPEFREARNNFFNKYVEENRDDDIAYVSNWIDKYKNDFYRDNAKLENNFMFIKNIRMFQENSKRFLDLNPDVVDQEEFNFIPSAPQNFPKEFSYLFDASKGVYTFVKENSSFWFDGESLVLSSGQHFFNKTIIIPRGTKLVVKPGAVINLAPDVSVISFSPVEMIGTEINPIKIQRSVSDKHWGVFAVINAEDNESKVSFVRVDGGGEDIINQIYISGMMAFHNSNVSIDNSSFSNASGDDSLNIKNSRAILNDNMFKNSFQDGVDFDAVGLDSSFQNGVFTEIGGDAIDLSWSSLSVTDSVINNCGDKGISIGERSKMNNISNVKISNCSIGIAVKDQSEARVMNSTIENNKTGISLYQKKEFFGGSYAEIIDTFFGGNSSNYSVDKNSSYIEN